MENRKEHLQMFSKERDVNRTMQQVTWNGGSMAVSEESRILVPTLHCELGRSCFIPRITGILS